MSVVSSDYILPFIVSAVSKINNTIHINRGAWDVIVKISLTSLFRHLYILVLIEPEFIAWRPKLRNSLCKKANAVLNKPELKKESVYKYAFKVHEACITLMLWESCLGIYGRLKVAGVDEEDARNISTWLYPREKVYKFRDGIYYRYTQNGVKQII